MNYTVEWRNDQYLIVLYMQDKIGMVVYMHMYCIYTVCTTVIHVYNTIRGNYTVCTHFDCLVQILLAQHGAAILGQCKNIYSNARTVFGEEFLSNLECQSVKCPLVLAHFVCQTINYLVSTVLSASACIVWSVTRDVILLTEKDILQCTKYFKYSFYKYSIYISIYWL